jgi:hypothetical protein
MERLIGRAFINDDFRRRLLDDPEGTAAAVNITLSPVQAARIRSLDAAKAHRIAEHFQQESVGGDEGVQATGLW